MAALIKPKEYDWKDSNLALFGSDTERQVKKESAQTEKAWRNAGKDVGIQIWRIVKFKVTAWPKDDYGKFFNGDSYIVLNTYKNEGSEELQFDVHFWIGKYSTQDEYGTAAYKTVELDTYLDDVPIQHREVQGHESELFKSYFKTITILQGGADSGFKHVLPEEYKPRLFHVHGDKHKVMVKEIPRCKNRLDETDVFILDLGLTIYQWNGRGANKDERFRARQYTQSIADERSGKPKVEILDQESTSTCEEFMQHLDQPDEDDSDCQDSSEDITKLFRLSDESGKMKMSETKTGPVTKDDFDSKDVFILDTAKELFVWIGLQTSPAEKKNAMTYAHDYLKASKHPLLSVTCVKEGRRVNAFESAMAA